ncbi:hypothetical protein J2847_005888 [Azospirillum agricola]|uniref:hypothetical protein n=1 Tax=Azospirillum agricola TaxID=1720247 RepID=UPI001AE76629|nr:hypothetical protein [Azospirillum agricola]MBP2232559.1 hypothetical protein [Azospirillum agricola]
MPIKPLADEWLLEALRLLDLHGISRTAAPHATKLNLRGDVLGIGVPKSTFEGRIKEARRRIEAGSLAYQREKPRVRVKAATENGAMRDGSPPAEAVTDRERVQFQDRIRDLEAKLRQAYREDLDTEKVRTSILGLTADTPEPPAWLVDERTGGSAPGVPVTIWSDWHFGEVVRAVEVGGVNEFNIAVATERVRRLVERTIDLCFSHMVRPEYPGIVVCLGGDLISGDIHEELAVSNELMTAPTLLELQGVLIWALTQMADRFGRVFVPCVVGNHGRMTHKPRAKGRVHTSFEWLLYCQLERHFQGDSRIQFQIPGEADAHFRVYGHRYMLTHGDSLGVRGGDGIIGLLGPVTRGTIKLRNSEAQIGRDFDTVVMGHWHQYLPMSGCIVNGALKGYDEYARLFLRARYQEPIQALWFTHPTRGVTFQVPVYLDETRRASSEEWLAWRASA